MVGLDGGMLEADGCWMVGMDGGMLDADGCWMVGMDSWTQTDLGQRSTHTTNCIALTALLG